MVCWRIILIYAQNHVDACSNGNILFDRNTLRHVIKFYDTVWRHPFCQSCFLLNLILSNINAWYLANNLFVLFLFIMTGHRILHEASLLKGQNVNMTFAGKKRWKPKAGLVHWPSHKRLDTISFTPLLFAWTWERDLISSSVPFCLSNVRLLGNTMTKRLLTF